MKKHNDIPGKSLSNEKSKDKKFFTMTPDTLAAFEGRKKKHSKLLYLEK